MNSIKRPNFFIIGAPKCGTTSLASWLGEHPNIFMSMPKEPRFFNTDYEAPGRPNSLSEYEKLFKNTKECHKVIGEATTGYLRSNAAVPYILKYSPDSRFVVCLRNPVEMVFSVHSQLVKMGIETEVDFKRAWSLQSERKRGSSIPKTCHDAKVLQYGQNCMLGKQLEKLFSYVPFERVLFLFLGDIKLDPGNEYRRVLSFLNVKDDLRSEFPVKNERSVPRYPFLSQLVRSIRLIMVRFGWKRGLGIGRLIARFNNKKQAAKIDDEMAAVLQSCFADDIRLLSKETGCDLSDWLNP